MAALTLVAVSVWLAYRGKPTLFTIIPAVFMMVTTMTGLVLLLVKTYVPRHNVPLIVADVLLLVLAFGVAVLAAKKLLQPRRGSDERKEIPPAIAKAG